MNFVADDPEARERRARLRRETWSVEPLSSHPPAPPASLLDRLEQLEHLRRIACAMAGIPYPEGPTPRHERLAWPMERIG
jgi:hypothetical protein